MPAGGWHSRGPLSTVRGRLAVLLLLWFTSIGTGIAQTQAVHAGLAGRLVVGYQGWFGCPNDFERHSDWPHWFAGPPSGKSWLVDMVPAVPEIAPEDLCDTGIPRADGKGNLQLFSSQNAKVVSSHFRWMREHGIEGVAAQRFVGPLAKPALQRRADNALKNIEAAARLHGRFFFLTYDVSGADPRTVIDTLRSDWSRLERELNLTQSTAYLRDQGKPVLQIWGFGFSDRPGEPEAVAELLTELREGRSGLPAVTLVGGVPTHWRTLDGDSKRDPAWAQVYRRFDVISPWSVGRFSNDAEANAFLINFVQPDLVETQRLGVGYMPVVFPGFSWHHLMSVRNPQQPAVLNRIPRRCGQFLWKQVVNLLGARVQTLYAAMFDEVDEGTALFRIESDVGALPAGANMVTLHQDGCKLPDDWYLRVTGVAARYLKEQRVPPPDLDRVMKP
jgi:hypothetical protein